MLKLFHKYREVLLYLFFGAATTIVNYLVYFGALDWLHWDYRPSNVLAWFLSVLFAFFTNKFFVFQSKTTTPKHFLKEGLLFYWYRALSFVIDMGMMILLISGMHWSDFAAKTLTQIVVIAMNYFFSKFLIFKENDPTPPVD